MLEPLQKLLTDSGLDARLAVISAHAILIAGVLIVSWLAAQLSKRVLLRGISKLISTTQTQWDDAFLREGVFHRLAQIAPAIVIYLFASAFGDAEAWIERLALVYMIVVTARVINALLDASLGIYQSTDASREKPIQAWVQVTSMVVYLVTGIFVVSTLLEREPWGLLTGLGAISAVVLLVFRDSILGFVASLQLASNNMVTRGDWIEMPKYGADGDVIEVSLNTVKVRNWDKTVTTIPTQALISDSFKNWRGMTESGGRRIKRSVTIDIGTIRLCDEEMLRRFEKFELIRDYLQRKIGETEAYNREHGFDTSELINGRRLTNVGTFRAYIEAYLRDHAKIHKDMTFLVRQLPPGKDGLPIEIYVFSNDQAWVSFEGIQSDIFDHILAVAREFGLRIYQAPSGHDLIEAGREIARGDVP